MGLRVIEKIEDLKLLAPCSKDGSLPLTLCNKISKEGHLGYSWAILFKIQILLCITSDFTTTKFYNLLYSTIWGSIT